MPSTGPQLACDSGVDVATLTQLVRRMCEQSADLGAPTSSKQLLHELSSDSNNKSCSAELAQSAMDVSAWQTCSWISAMQSVEKNVADALREVASDEGTSLETEDPSGEDTMELKLAQLRNTVRLQIAAPLFKASGDAQEQAGRPLTVWSFSYDVLSLLAQTWHLARVRGLQVQWLKSSITSQQTETKTGGADRESVLKLKTILKEKSWELARAQARIELLESDLINSDQQFLQLERAKQRETSCREECERRLHSLQVDNHRKLSSAKDALQQAKEALTDARDRMHCSSELEAAFKNCHEQVQKLEQPQQQQKSCGAAGSSKVRSARDYSGGRPSSLRPCSRIRCEAACTSVGAISQRGMSSSRTSLAVVRRGASMMMCNADSARSDTRAPAEENAPNKMLSLHGPTIFSAKVTTANRQWQACQDRLVDCKQDCQRHEALSTAAARQMRRWPPA